MNAFGLRCAVGRSGVKCWIDSLLSSRPRRSCDGIEGLLRTTGPIRLALEGDASGCNASELSSSAWRARTRAGATIGSKAPSFLHTKKFLILDRDSKFIAAFLSILKSGGVRAIRCPPHAPNCNAYAERFVRSITSACLDRMIFFGSATLRHALAEYALHYNAERNHQGVGNRLIHPIENGASPDAPVLRRKRLGALLSFYHRLAA